MKDSIQIIRIIVLLIVSIIVSINSQSLHVNIGKSIIQSNREWTRIKLNITDGNSLSTLPNNLDKPNY